MFYKEWRTVRLKCGVWLLVYTMCGLSVWFGTARSETVYASSAFRVIASNIPPDTNNTLFQNWLLVSALATLFITVLGGIDLVSEENDKGTLSFLLSRPLSRVRIYTSKVGLNVIGLVGTYGLASLVMLGLDQMPRQIAYYRSDVVGECFETAETLVGSIPARTSNPGEVLPTLLLITLVGAGIICLSGLVSTLTRTTMQTLAAMMSIMLVTSLLYGALANQMSWSFINFQVYQLSPLLIVPTVLLTLALFLAGVLVFKQREY